MASDAEFGGNPSRSPRTRPRVFGHRGASAQVTENTLAAFRRAMADGADGVELDVRRCATGEVVVFHDGDLRRLAGRPERIARLPLAALREVQLAGGGEIPTLAEALEACGPGALVNVELKHDGILPGGGLALIRAVAEAVARADAARRVLISSFSPTTLWLWRRLQPDVPCGLLFDATPGFRRPWPVGTAWLLPLVRPAAAHPESRLCTPAAVSDWQRRGYAVNVWTVDDPVRLRELAALGVSGIITNDPARALSVLSLTP
jgi:glycerophosphoryl diester phosphodiesterase